MTFPTSAGGPGELASGLFAWDEHADDRIRYFSGTAEYRYDVSSLRLPDVARTDGWLGRLVLDLGEVHDMAEVLLDDRLLASLWRPRFAVDVDDAIRTARVLTVRVTNTWANRMIGDEGEPEDADWGPGIFADDRTLVAWPEWLRSGARPGRRVSFATTRQDIARDPLSRSGLLGPVTIGTILVKRSPGKGGERLP